MHSADDIEIQLWEYIDNVCDEAMRARIAQLIACDDVWQQKYESLLAFNSSLQQIEPEHTSMRFTKNVMESIAGLHVAQPTKTYINKWVVRSIAAVFVLLVGFVLIYALQGLHWSNEPSKKSLSYSGMFDGNFAVYVALTNILVGIVLIDTWLRRKKKAIN